MKNKLSQGAVSVLLGVSMTFGMAPTTVIAQDANATQNLTQREPEGTVGEKTPTSVNAAAELTPGEQRTETQTVAQSSSNDASKEETANDQDAAEKSAEDTVTDTMFASEQPAPAAEPTTAQVEADETHAHSNVTFTKWESTNSLPTTSGNYYLAKDVDLGTSQWVIPENTNIKLCLNGNTIATSFANEGQGAVAVSKGAVLDLYDCSDKGTLKGTDKTKGTGIDVQGGGTFNMHGGTITSFATGVFTNLTVLKDDPSQLATGVFTMDAGTIFDNGAHGVYVFSGSATMSGGKITNNGSNADNGGGVYVSYSTFKMSGGEISGNTAVDNGGGVALFKAEEFTMTGGTITGNAAAKVGGGVWTDNGKSIINLLGGSITGNKGGQTAGGIFLSSDSILNVSGTPKVTDNLVGSDAKNVYLSAKTLTVAGKLEDGASLGITHVNGEGATDTGAFTAGYKDKENAAHPDTYFTSDDPAYVVGWTEDGKEARLVVAYTVTVKDSTNGTVAVSKTKAAAGDAIAITIVPNDGYKLKKNSLKVVDANDKAVEVTDNTFVMPESNVTVSASFIQTNCTLTFDANGGSGTMDPQVVESETNITLEANKFTRSGYTFSGWNTKADGTGTNFKDKAAVRLTQDVTLYAQWKKNATTPTTGSNSSTTSMTTSTSSSTSTPKTADPLSFASVVAAAATGVGLTFAGLRGKKRER